MASELFKVSQYSDMALQYLRLEAKVSDFHIAAFPLRELVMALSRKFAAQFVLKKLSLDMDVPEDLHLKSDAKWLGLALEQLISNAIKYTDQGSVRIVWDGAARCLMIQDSGADIAPEDLPRVFERGYAGPGQGADERSTGLGLFLCRQICEKLGLDLRLSSRLGEGTEALVCFPLEAPEVE